jgi:hypothetical protein
MRKRARIDANQPEIVKALRSIGCSVLPIHQLGDGAPDLLVGRRGKNILLEIKDGDKPPSERKLTPDEQDFLAAWCGQYSIVETVQQAIDAVIRNA